MGLERPTAWLILAVVALALFGYKRLPDASRSVGRSLRIFKSEMKGLATDDEEREAAAPAAAPPVPPPPAVVVPVAPAPPAASVEIATAPPESAPADGVATAPRAD